MNNGYGCVPPFAYDMQIVFEWAVMLRSVVDVVGLALGIIGTVTMELMQRRFIANSIHTRGDPCWMRLRLGCCFQTVEVSFSLTTHGPHAIRSPREIVHDHCYGTQFAWGLVAHRARCRAADRVTLARPSTVIARGSIFSNCRRHDERGRGSCQP